MGHRSFAQVVLLAALSLAVTAGCGGRGRRGGGGGGGGNETPVDSSVPRDSGNGTTPDAGGQNQDECDTPDERRCTSATTLESCVNVGGTLSWRPQTCNGGTTCQDGQCVPTENEALGSFEVCNRVRTAQCALIVDCCSSEFDCGAGGLPSEVYASTSSCVSYTESEQGACPNDGNEYSESAVSRCESDYRSFDCTQFLVDQTYPSSCDAAATPL